MLRMNYGIRRVLCLWKQIESGKATSLTKAISMSGARALKMSMILNGPGEEEAVFQALQHGSTLPFIPRYSKSFRLACSSPHTNTEPCLVENPLPSLSLLGEHGQVFGLNSALLLRGNKSVSSLLFAVATALMSIKTGPLQHW